MKKSYLIIIIAAFTLFLGCGHKPKMYLFFLDTTLSAPTLEARNMVRSEALILGEALKMKPKDVLVVYPVHAFTESAGPILRLGGPGLRGDLRDKKRILEWKENYLKPAIKGIWKEKIARDRRTRTSLFPVLGKIQNGMRNGYEVIPVIISDMINDNNKESFTNNFSKIDFDFKKYAVQKAEKLGYTGKFSGIKIFIRIPSTPHGNHAFELIKRQVLDFWIEFFSACGAIVVHEDL